MSRSTCLRSLLLGTIGACACAQIAFAANFNIPSGDLATALDAYAAQTGVELIVSEDALKGRHSDGASGQISADDALAQILKGTGFTIHREAGAIALVPEHRRSSSASDDVEMQFAQAAPTKAIETVTVTSSKLGGADVQSVPIAITALSQEQLTATQTAGGPDLVKQVPNLTFSKTNFTGYNIQIRGIGTQAISVTTDPAVAVAFNDIPFIRNHFFEQEFYDIGQLEVLRGPQGTLYGRNATAGVVNVVSARPTDQFEAMASLDVGNYQNRRVEGMLNIPVADDRLDIRVAGEWTKRDGYTFDKTTDKSVDGRDLWSGRVTVGWKPIESLQTYLVWEHFSEDDDRVRSAKQVCEKDPGPTSVDGLDLSSLPGNGPNYPPAYFTNFAKTWLSQGCLPASFYSKDAYETPNGQTLPFVAFGEFFVGIGNGPHGALLNQIDPYASQTQSQDLRVIQSELTPSYRAKNDTVEFNADFAVTPALTLTSQTGYNKDFLYSTEDFNRFDTAPGLFGEGVSTIGSSSPADPAPGGSIAIRNWAAQAAWSAKTCRRSAPGNSPRKCGWLPVSAVRSISVPAPITCTIRRSKITMSSSTSSRPRSRSPTGKVRATLRRVIPKLPTFLRSQSRQSPIRQTLTVFFHWALAALWACRLFFRLRLCDCTWRKRSRHLHRSESHRPAEWSRAQLFPQRESLSPEFHGRFWRGLLSDNAGSEAHRRSALD